MVEFMIARTEPIVILALMLLTALRSAGADERPTVSIALEPATISLPYNQGQADAHLRIKVLQGTLPALTLIARPAKSGDRLTPIKFENGKDYLELDPASLGKDIPITLGPFASPGSYEGAIEVDSTTGDTLTSIKVIATRSDPSFSPTILSDLLKNGELDFVGKLHDQFPFRVQNPQSGLERTFALSMLGSQPNTQGGQGSANPAGQRIEIEPQRVHLKPGQDQPVIATLAKPIPASAQYFDLRISASDDEDLFKDTLLRVKDLSTDTWRWLELLGLVTLGAVFSVIVNNVFPTSLGKYNNRIAITQIENAINNCVYASGFLQSALLAESAHLRLLNGAVNWYQLSKTENFEQIGRAIAALKDRVDAASSISSLRQQISQSGNTYPIITMAQVEAKLLQAENALLDGEAANARARREEAAQIRTTGIADSSLAVLRTDLANGINDLTAVPAPAGRDPFVQALLADLQSQIPKIPNLTISKLLEVERGYRIALTYVEVGEPAMTQNPGNEAFKSAVRELLDLLRANPTSQGTALRAALLSSNLCPSDIEAAIALPTPGRIVCDAQPHVYDLNDYSFEFGDVRLASVPAATRLVEFDWNFKDGTSSSHFERCKHFYISQRRYQKGLPSYLFRWIKAKETQFVIEVAVTAPSRASTAIVKKTITVRAAQSSGKGIVGVQVVGFSISTLMAVLAAFGAQYATTPDSLTVATGLTAVLFGFGLDQLRGKVVTR